MVGNDIYKDINFILNSEINAYQKQIKVISIISEMISAYIFTVAILDYL